MQSIVPEAPVNMRALARLAVILSLTALLLVLTVLSIGVGIAPAANAVPPAPGFPVKIGMLLPLSGGLQSFGEQVRDGALIANAEAEDAGWSIDVVYGDTQCNYQQAITAANELIVNQGVDYVIGAVCSSTSIASSEIAGANGVVQISPASTHPLLTMNSNEQSLLLPGFLPRPVPEQGDGHGSG